MRKNNLRIIARLDIKNQNLIKPVQLEGLRVVGDPNIFAKKYYEEGADEIFFLDSVASLYQRSYLEDIIENSVKDIFIPITVGGGIKSTNDVERILRIGADKISINTAAVHRPDIINEVSNEFGSQCMVVSIEAKQMSEDLWVVYTNNGREKTSINVTEWIKQVQDLGAGEIILTSIDKEGTRRGFDVQLIETIHKFIKIPLIVSGGMGNISDIHEVIEYKNISGVAMADFIHFERMKISEIKKDLLTANVEVRNF